MWWPESARLPRLPGMPVVRRMLGMLGLSVLAPIVGAVVGGARGAESEPAPTARARDLSERARELLATAFREPLSLTELAIDIIGAEAMTPSGRDAASGVGQDDVGAPYSSQAWVTTFIGARPGTIYSGSSEIQRNIIGERVLGLPREPQVDQGVAWKDLRRA